MEIQQEKMGTKGSFYVEENEERMAEMTYVFAGDDKFIIDHTDVADSARGLGLGIKLVEHAVAYARENNLKILPLCPFARSVFNKHPEFSDAVFA